MEKNLYDYRYKLQDQVKNNYGKVVYSFTSHEKEIKILKKRSEKIKRWQTILSAITTGSFISTIFSFTNYSGIIGAICSVILLSLNTYSLNTDYDAKIKTHMEIADRLWTIRERYLSLLIDFDYLEIDEIKLSRDKLLDETALIYKNGIRTSNKSYKLAQNALKSEEEQFFTNQELNMLLPITLREENFQEEHLHKNN